MHEHGRLEPAQGGLHFAGSVARCEVLVVESSAVVLCEAAERRFEIQKGFDFDAYIGESFGVIAEKAVRVCIRFDRRWAEYVQERTWHESQKFKKCRGGGIELTMEVGSTPDLRTWILSFGSGAEVLEPKALRDEVAAEFGDALARYRE